jgi:hypothetical protein
MDVYERVAYHAGMPPRSEERRNQQAGNTGGDTTSPASLPEGTLMTDALGRAFPAAAASARRIHAIAAGLAATGVATSTNGDSLTGLDVTATARPAGYAQTEIMLDEDGYAEIRWYTNPAAPAADVTAALARVLAAVTAAPSVLAPAPLPTSGLL